MYKKPTCTQLERTLNARKRIFYVQHQTKPAESKEAVHEDGERLWERTVQGRQQVCHREAPLLVLPPFHPSLILYRSPRACLLAIRPQNTSVISPCSRKVPAVTEPTSSIMNLMEIPLRIETYGRVFPRFNCILTSGSIDLRLLFFHLPDISRACLPCPM